MLFFKYHMINSIALVVFFCIPGVFGKDSRLRQTFARLYPKDSKAGFFIPVFFLGSLTHLFDLIYLIRGINFKLARGKANSSIWEMWIHR